jgi:hypothetical protein
MLEAVRVPTEPSSPGAGKAEPGLGAGMSAAAAPAATAGIP